MEIALYIFWTALFLVVYTYLGYGLLLWMLVKLRRTWLGLTPVPDLVYESVTLVIPAYNEMSCIAEKVENCFALEYPREQLRIIFVTEGSTDGTTEYLSNIAGIEVVGGTERRGKIEAINQVMPLVNSAIVIFTDANTMLNPDAIKYIVRHYSNPMVGAVSGEKRIKVAESEMAAGAGEGLYWRYESTLKRLDAELNTIVGAAGELFSIRTSLYEPVEKDTLLDDFIISLRIAAKGYKVAYEPNAYALEEPSFSILDEMKRKVRICAGGFQSIVRLRELLNPFRYGLLTFQYISHRVMRWAVAPFCLPLIFISGLWLAVYGHWFYQMAFLLQLLFYSVAISGYVLERRHIKLKIFFVPFYFFFMNYTVYLGLMRYLKSPAQSGIWEKVRRAGS